MKNFGALLTGVAVIAGVPGIAFAQSSAPVTPRGASGQAAQAPVGQPSAVAPAAPSTAPEMQGEGDIIVTAQKRAERLQDVPIAIVTQTGAQLARAGIVNTRDLAAVTPGLTFSTTGAWSQPSLRGVSSTATNPGAESPVAIYLDGIYQPSQTAQIFDLPDVQRVEVLKGPQGTLFGRNANAGAIQVFTLDPTFKTTGQISLTSGMFTGGSAHDGFEYGVKGFVSSALIPDKLAFSIAGNYNHNEGYLSDLSHNGRQAGAVDSRLIRGKLLLTPSNGVKFVATAYYGRRKDGASEAASIPDGLDVANGIPGAIIPTKPWTFAYDEPKPYYQTKTWGVSLRGDIDLADLGTLTTLTGYTDIKGTEAVDVDGAFVSNNPATRLTLCPACTAYRVNNPDRNLSTELDFASKKFGIFRITAGANYFYDSALQAANANDDGFFYSSRVKTHAYAGFAELTVNPIEALTIVGGARYTHEEAKGFGSVFGTSVGEFTKAKYNAVTPRASVRYALSHSTNLFFTYSKGFKSGVLQLPYCSPTPSFDCQPAKPEKLTSYEGGIKVGSRDLSASLSAFHYDYSNLQLLVFTGLSSNIENAATASITGFDADATYRLSHDLSVRGAISWIPTAKFSNYPNAAVFFSNTPTIDASGTRLLRAPKIPGTASVQYTHDMSNGANVEASANVSYSSKYRWEVTGRLVTKQYATLGVRLGYQPVNCPFKLIVFGRNLTNVGFIQGTLIDGTANLAFYAPPREVGGQIDFSF